jgi:hypothetical protein
MNRRDALKIFSASPVAPLVKSIETVRPQPGEMFVITCPTRLPPEAMGFLREQWELAWKGVTADVPKVMIFSGGFEIKTMKAPE